MSTVQGKFFTDMAVLESQVIAPPASVRNLVKCKILSCFFINVDVPNPVNKAGDEPKVVGGRSKKETAEAKKRRAAWEQATSSYHKACKLLDSFKTTQAMIKKEWDSNLITKGEVTQGMKRLLNCGQSTFLNMTGVNVANYANISTEMIGAVYNQELFRVANYTFLIHLESTGRVSVMAAVSHALEFTRFGRTMQGQEGWLPANWELIKNTDNLEADLGNLEESKTAVTVAGKPIDKSAGGSSSSKKKDSSSEDEIREEIKKYATRSVIEAGEDLEDFEVDQIVEIYNATNQDWPQDSRILQSCVEFLSIQKVEGDSEWSTLADAFCYEGFNVELMIKILIKNHAKSNDSTSVSVKGVNFRVKGLFPADIAFMIRLFLQRGNNLKKIIANSSPEAAELIGKKASLFNLSITDGPRASGSSLGREKVTLSRLAACFPSSACVTYSTSADLAPQFDYSELKEAVKDAGEDIPKYMLCPLFTSVTLSEDLDMSAPPSWCLLLNRLFDKMIHPDESDRTPEASIVKYADAAFKSKALNRTRRYNELVRAGLIDPSSESWVPAVKACFSEADALWEEERNAMAEESNQARKKK